MSGPRAEPPPTTSVARPGRAADAPRSPDLGQHVHGAAAVVELPAAMVGDVDPRDAVVERDLDVLRGRDALDGERDVEALLETLDRAPVERGLELAARRPPAPGPDMALG